MISDNKTLFELVIEPYANYQFKRDLSPGYTEREINILTNLEFLRALSDALEEKLERKRNG